MLSLIHISGALNSVARTVIGTTLTTLVSSYMAYLFTKEEMKGRKIWYRLTVATMYFSAGLIPGYLNIRMLGSVSYTHLDVYKRQRWSRASIFPDGSA